MFCFLLVAFLIYSSSSVHSALNGPCNINGKPGVCINTASCIARGGTYASGFCPKDPADIKCCVKGGPTIPENRCQRHVIDAGYKILNKFPGYVKVVYCYANKPGEHGKGLALDFMVGAYSPHGREIAEWVMNNAASLKVLYVIWGQRIWNVDRDKTPRSWNNWRQMEDRGDVTQNHWDHPHVSFKP